MGIFAVSGSASGIGKAVAEVIAARGDRVIGVDLRGADVEADLSKAEGRAAASEAVLALVDAEGGALDGIVSCAGVGGIVNPGSLVMSVNYFGAVHFLESLRPALARAAQPAAVGIISNSTTLMPNLPQDLLAACRDGNEPLARELGDKHGWAAYGGSKTAFAHWVRRNAVSDDWAGAGIRLNGVAPGRVRTALDAQQLADERLRGAIEGLPIPLGGPTQPEDIAHFVAFLLSEHGRFFCGSILFQDGGTDALVRPDDWPVGITGEMPEVMRR